MAVIGGVLVAFVERDAPKAFEEAARALDEAQVFLVQRNQLASEIITLRRQFQRERELRVAIRAMQDGIEQAIVGKRPLESTIKEMISLAARPLSAAMAFDAAERWVISAFRYTTESDDPRLVRVAQCRAERWEESAPGREWRSGEGYAGAAYLRNGDVILEDAQDPAVAAVIAIPVDKQRDSDRTRYRSVAAVPVRANGAREPWGVVVVTSDRKGRFGTAPGSAEESQAEAVRVLAAMVALAIVSEHKLALAVALETSG